MDICEILLVALLVIFTVVPLGVIMFIVEIVCRRRLKRQRNRIGSRRILNHVGLSMLQMVNPKIIIRLVRLISCILYNGVALIVIPDCTEAIAFYTKIVTAAHVGVEGQIQSLKSVEVHILLVALVISVTLLKFWFRTEVNLLCKREVAYAISAKERKERQRFGKGC